MMFRCPHCQATERFMVSATAIVEVEVFQSRDGSVVHEVDAPQDVTWEDDSAIVCQSCFYNGTVDAFTVDDAAC